MYLSALYELYSERSVIPKKNSWLTRIRQNIPSPAYLEDLENKELSGDDRQFSSFAYRILAVRNLGRLLRETNGFEGSIETVERIEDLLTNWRVHLPESKRDALNKDCKVDEMMFQAHMVTHA